MFSFTSERAPLGHSLRVNSELCPPPSVGDAPHNLLGVCPGVLTSSTSAQHPPPSWAAPASPSSLYQPGRCHLSLWGTQGTQLPEWAHSALSLSCCLLPRPCTQVTTFLPGFALWHAAVGSITGFGIQCPLTFCLSLTPSSTLFGFCFVPVIAFVLDLLSTPPMMSPNWGLPDP